MATPKKVLASFETEDTDSFCLPETPKKYDLYALTKGKALHVYDNRMDTTFYLSINRTLASIITLHCKNEGINRDFFISVAIVDYLKRNKIIATRLPEEHFPSRLPNMPKRPGTKKRRPRKTPLFNLRRRRWYGE